LRAGWVGVYWRRRHNLEISSLFGAEPTPRSR
jgi:hypothetical protein